MVNAFHINPDPAKNRKEKKAGELERNCIPSGSFSLNILFHPTATEDQKAEVVHALKLFGLLGGLGARMRRGYGSLALTELRRGDGLIFSAPADREAYIAALKAVIPRSRASGDGFPITAFAADSRVYVENETFDTALMAHDALGEAFKRYRAWRLPQGEQPNFTGDHHWFRKCGTPAEPASDPPRRIAFGLPQNYDKKTSVAPEGFDRRASPLLFHVHRIGARYCGVSTYLPTLFLPRNQVEERVTNKARVTKSYDFKADGRPVIEAFLDGSVNASVKTVHGAPYLTGGNIL